MGGYAAPNPEIKGVSLHPEQTPPLKLCCPRSFSKILRLGRTLYGGAKVGALDDNPT